MESDSSPKADAALSPRAVTLVDLAKAAGVSRTTASNAFNRPDQLSPKLRARVLKIADKMGYAGPNPMARMLRTGQAGSIGVVFGHSLTVGFTVPTAIASLTSGGGRTRAGTTASTSTGDDGSVTFELNP